MFSTTTRVTAIKIDGKRYTTIRKDKGFVTDAMKERSYLPKVRMTLRASALFRAK